MKIKWMLVVKKNMVRVLPMIRTAVQDQKGNVAPVLMVIVRQQPPQPPQRTQLLPPPQRTQLHQIRAAVAGVIQEHRPLSQPQQKQPRHLFVWIVIQPQHHQNPQPQPQKQPRR